MSAVAVLRLPLTTNLSGFVSLLQRLRIPHRVSEESGEQVLWVPDAPQLADEVRDLYTRFPEGDEHFQLAQDAPNVTYKPPGLIEQLRNSPVTALVLLVTLLVAGMTLLGDNLEVIRWLTFQDFRISGEYATFLPLSDSLAAGQWWRIVSPMLIHFGILHLAMNGMWFWELGRRIEIRQGSLSLLQIGRAHV